MFMILVVLITYWCYGKKELCSVDLLAIVLLKAVHNHACILVCVPIILKMHIVTLLSSYVNIQVDSLAQQPRSYLFFTFSRCEFNVVKLSFILYVSAMQILAKLGIIFDSESKGNWGVRIHFESRIYRTMQSII